MEKPSEIVNDDAALWKRNRELAIEDYDEPDQTPDFYTPSDDPEELEITDKDVHNDLNKLKLTQPTAELLVSIMDVMVPALVVFFTKNKDNKATFKLDPDEKETLQDAFANYLKETSFEMSPGVLLITAIGAVYLPKFAEIKLPPKTDVKQISYEQAQDGTNADMRNQRNGQDHMAGQ